MAAIEAPQQREVIVAAEGVDRRAVILQGLGTTSGRQQGADGAACFGVSRLGFQHLDDIGQGRHQVLVFWR